MKWFFFDCYSIVIPSSFALEFWTEFDTFLETARVWILLCTCFSSFVRWKLSNNAIYTQSAFHVPVVEGLLAFVTKYAMTRSALRALCLPMLSTLTNIFCKRDFISFLLKWVLNKYSWRCHPFFTTYWRAIYTKCILCVCLSTVHKHSLHKSMLLYTKCTYMKCTLCVRVNARL